MARANAMFRSIVVRQLRANAHTGALASLALAAIHGGILAMASSAAARWYSVGMIGLLAVLAVAFGVASRRILRRPGVVELFENTGSVLRVTSDDRMVRVLLRSGDEVRIGIKARERDKTLNLLRGHSPNADFTAHG
jgi:hypothetical protein